MAEVETLIVVGLTVAGATYAAHLARIVIEPARVVCFMSGLAVCCVALFGPIEAASADDLVVHMTQHVLLMAIAAPLLALGIPARRVPARPSAVLGAAVLVHSAVLVGWHVPALYDAAERSNPVHGAEHLSFLGAGVAVWWVATAVPHSMRGAAALAVFVVSLPCTILGAALTLAAQPWYAAYPSLGDQQIAGVVMWAFQNLVYLAGSAALFVTWIGRSDQFAEAGSVGSRFP